MCHEWYHNHKWHFSMPQSQQIGNNIANFVIGFNYEPHWLFSLSDKSQCLHALDLSLVPKVNACRHWHLSLVTKVNAIMHYNMCTFMASNRIQWQSLQCHIVRVNTVDVCLHLGGETADIPHFLLLKFYHVLLDENYILIHLIWVLFGAVTAGCRLIKANAS